jgi:predicted ATP-binding protein involved in virulence
MTINQGRTFCRMFFHKLLATLYKTWKTKIRCFREYESGIECLSVVTKRRKCNYVDMTRPQFIRLNESYDQWGTFTELWR